MALQGRERTLKLIDAPRAPDHVFWIVGPETSVGALLYGLVADGAICRVSYMRGRAAADIVAEWQAAWPRTTFVPAPKGMVADEDSVVLTGTAFQRAVWRVMQKIPAGKVLSYGDVAAKIGKPKAARAIGMACGANPVPYLVPCHRVIAAGGKIGGFSGGEGLPVKRALLAAEGIFL